MIIISLSDFFQPTGMDRLRRSYIFIIRSNDCHPVTLSPYHPITFSSGSLVQNLCIDFP